MICDVPFVGKRWVHQIEDYDRERGISYWTKNYRTGIEFEDPDALTRRYEYFDPISTLPEEGKAYWRERIRSGPASSSRRTPESRVPGRPGSIRRRRPANAESVTLTG